MALGEINLFAWKSKAQLKQEEENYAKWAFPYGEPQREKILTILHEIFPKQSDANLLIPYLTCKELYAKFCKTPDLSDYAINRLLVDVKKYKRLIRKNEMPLYVAVVVADSQVDDRLEYQTAAEIMAMARGFEVTKT